MSALGILFALLGVALAWLFGMWLRKRGVSEGSSMLCAIFIGRVMMIIANAVEGAIK